MPAEGEACYHDRIQFFPGRLAQLVERYPYKVDVVGSRPATPTITTNLFCVILFTRKCFDEGGYAK